MDGKGNRRLKLVRRRQHNDMRSNWFTVLKFLKTNKHSFLSGVLLVVIVVLLFGIFSQFQAPSMSTPPNGVTVITYSRFVEQAKAGNVLAVTIQGYDLNGLLANPLPQSHAGIATPAATLGVKNASATDTTISSWDHYMSGGYTTRPNTKTAPAIDPAHAVYTKIPVDSDANLTQLLLSKHVLINTLPVVTPPIWLGLLWKLIPIIFFVLVLLLILAPRNNTRSFRSFDDRITQLGKSRARRFKRAKEATQTKTGSEIVGGQGAPKTVTPEKPTSLPKIFGQEEKTGSTRVSLESPVTFSDVAGIDEVRTELEEIVQFLRSPERFDRLGARIPRGALLVGRPGTGKTLLAKAVAGEAGVPFFSISASEFVEMFVGVGASRVRDLFNKARQSAPCVIFIDEIDAVGHKRSMRISGNDERDQTLNQLLVELDGFDGRKAVVVLAATNRVDILDKALLRPGRFDRHITISYPDRAGREAILKVHTRCTPLGEDVSLECLSRLTTGMSGADLANLVNEAALCAARQNFEHLTHTCFEDALARVQLGALRPIVMSETERRVIAYHEGGHALVAYHLPQADTVNHVTILPRGQSLGVTQFTTEEDRYNYSRETLMARIAVGLGGRVAEEVIFGLERVTTGAEDDLQGVTDLARRMVTRWGMSEQVGVVFTDYSADAAAMSLNAQRIDPAVLSSRSCLLVADTTGRLMLDGPSGDDNMSEHGREFAVSNGAVRNTCGSISMATLIDFEVQRIIKEGHAIARTLLSEYYDQLTRLAEALMEHEQLDRKQFEQLLQE